MYQSNKEEQLKSIKNKLKTLQTRLTTQKKIKASFVKGNPSLPKNLNLVQHGNYFVVRFKKKSDIYYHSYQFEHEYVDQEIKKLKTRMGFLTFKRNRIQDELDGLKTYISNP
jgi:hypothetical protein